MTSELKDILESVNKNLIKSDKRDRLLIRSVKFLQRLWDKDEGLPYLLDRLERLVFNLNSKLCGMKDLENFLCSEKRTIKAQYKIIEDLIKKLNDQQIWLFENIDNYVNNALEDRLKLLVKKKEKTND